MLSRMSDDDLVQLLIEYRAFDDSESKMLCEAIETEIFFRRVLESPGT